MKRLMSLSLALMLVLSLTACATPEKPTDYPEDFCFSLEWSVEGDGTYDSKTGRLVKQKTAKKVEDYTTTFFLSDEQKAELFELISDMDPETYPDEYNPVIGSTQPSMSIVLSVTYDGKTKTISCANVALTGEPDGPAGEKFIAVYNRIIEMIMLSAEWQLLPDYEHLYM